MVTCCSESMLPAVALGRRCRRCRRCRHCHCRCRHCRYCRRYCRRHCRRHCRHYCRHCCAPIDFFSSTLPAVAWCPFPDPSGLLLSLLSPAATPAPHRRSDAASAVPLPPASATPTPSLAWSAPPRLGPPSLPFQTVSRTLTRFYWPGQPRLVL